MLMWSFRNIFLGLERFRGSTSTKRNHKTMVSQMDTIKKDAKSLKLYYVMKYVTYKLKEGMKLIFVNLRRKTKSCTGNVAPEWWYFCLDICHSFSTLSQFSLKKFSRFQKETLLATSLQRNSTNISKILGLANNYQPENDWKRHFNRKLFMRYLVTTGSNGKFVDGH